MSDKTPQKKVIIEIADYIFANPDKNREAVLSYFVTRCRKNRRTVERYVKQAKEHNKTRIQLQEKAKDEILVAVAKESFKTKVASREQVLEKLTKLMEEAKKEDNQIRAITVMAGMQGWNAPIKSEVNVNQQQSISLMLLEKQMDAFEVLVKPKPEHANISELLYGGGAGGGKSMLGCFWLLWQAVHCHGTRWVMGRNTLKTLKETTLNSFFEAARICGNLKYDYVENKGIRFPNGSEILLKDLAYYPSDPEFSELGSLEITGAFVDECDQITEKAWNVLKSRIRYKLDDHGLTPKILGTCNPSRNWVFTRFYEPFIEGKLPENRMFIQSLLRDNSKISKHYEKNLDELDEMQRKRLKDGDWYYIDMSDKWAYAFKKDKHVGKTELNPSETVYLSFDFNRNPITCLVSQHYDNHFYGIEQIEIDNCTIYRLCEVIKERYPGCFFLVTGDVSGKNVSTVSSLNNFDVIKMSLDLTRNQMQYSGQNPPLAQNRILVNAMLERYPMVFDADKCGPLIRDFEIVKSDNDGKPVKLNRNDPAQRADSLDCFRYTLNRYFGNFLKYLAE